jgi:hypothetical protein
MLFICWLQTVSMSEPSAFLCSSVYYANQTSSGDKQAAQLLQKPPLLLRAGGRLLAPFRRNFFASLRASASAPVAREENKETTMHGRTRVDPFQWMKDDNWQQVLREPEVLRADIREHLEKENAYTDGVLAPTKALRDKLFKEMKGRISEVDASVPSRGKFPWPCMWC